MTPNFVPLLMKKKGKHKSRYFYCASLRGSSTFARLFW